MSAFGQAGFGSVNRRRQLQAQGQMDPYGQQVRAAKQAPTMTAYAQPTQQPAGQAPQQSAAAIKQQRMQQLPEGGYTGVWGNTVYYGADGKSPPASSNSNHYDASGRLMKLGMGAGWGYTGALDVNWQRESEIKSLTPTMSEADRLKVMTYSENDYGNWLKHAHGHAERARAASPGTAQPVQPQTRGTPYGSTPYGAYSAYNLGQNRGGDPSSASGQAYRQAALDVAAERGQGKLARNQTSGPDIAARATDAGAGGGMSPQEMLREANSRRLAYRQDRHGAEVGARLAERDANGLSGFLNQYRPESGIYQQAVARSMGETNRMELDLLLGRLRHDGFQSSDANATGNEAIAQSQDIFDPRTMEMTRAQDPRKFVELQRRQLGVDALPQPADLRNQYYDAQRAALMEQSDAFRSGRQAMEMEAMLGQRMRNFDDRQRSYGTGHYDPLTYGANSAYAYASGIRQEQDDLRKLIADTGRRRTNREAEEQRLREDPRAVFEDRARTLGTDWRDEVVQMAALSQSEAMMDQPLMRQAAQTLNQQLQQEAGYTGPYQDQYFIYNRSPWRK